MKHFLNKLHELVSVGKTEQAVKLLLNVFEDYERSSYQQKEDVSDLKMQIVLLSMD